MNVAETICQRIMSLLRDCLGIAGAAAGVCQACPSELDFCSTGHGASGILGCCARVAEWQTRRSQKPLFNDVRVRLSPRAPSAKQASPGSHDPGLAFCFYECPCHHPERSAAAAPRLSSRAQHRSSTPVVIPSAAHAVREVEGSRAVPTESLTAQTVGLPQRPTNRGMPCDVAIWNRNGRSRRSSTSSTSSGTSADFAMPMLV